jgi:plasmid stability protein
MANLTVRLPDDLLEEVKRNAARYELSLNAWALMVIRAAVDPENAADAVSRTRERLQRAGLLMVPEPKDLPKPDPKRLEEASRRLARGTPVSDFVSEDRGPY